MPARTGPDPAEHWDEVYATKGEQGVSWFQPEPVVSLELIAELAPEPVAPVIDVGGGASVLVDRLLARGHTDVTVLDVSARALHLAERRTGCPQRVHWVRADLLEWQPPRRFALWHDRAVFHFLTRSDQRARYRDLLTAGLAAGGHLVIGTFAADGPERCSGLPVARHDPDDLRDWLGPEFTPLTSRRELHRTPGGFEQPFTWLVAQRRANGGTL